MADDDTRGTKTARGSNQEKFPRYRTEIQQMMFVSGETGEVAVDTTTLIEGIVRQQVAEILTQATTLAGRRGVRSIGVEDLIFLIRHDKAKVARLRTFLSWKDVRKTARENDNDNKGGGGAEDFAAGGGDDGLAPNMPLNPADAAAKGMTKTKSKVGLPWDVSSFYSVQPPEREPPPDEDGPRDEEEEEMVSATLQRLKNADERTKSMTKDEYVHFSECRQASFTFRKAKRFREWAGFGIVTDGRPNDDIVDILGFLTFEIVQTLTEEALRAKAAEDAWVKLNGADNNKEKQDSAGDGEGGIFKKRKGDMGLFEATEEERTPVDARHIQEAFRRLQQSTKKVRTMGNYSSTHIRKAIRLI